MNRQNWDAVKGNIDAKGGKKVAATFEGLVAKTARQRPRRVRKTRKTDAGAVDTLRRFSAKPDVRRDKEYSDLSGRESYRC